MITRLLIREAAKRDIRQAFDYYQVCSPNLGHEFLRCVDVAIHSLQRMPKSYRVVYKSVRRVVIHKFPFCVYYVLSDQGISIIAVLHARRNPSRWQLR